MPAENEPLDPFGINYTTNIASFLNLREGAVFGRVSTTTLEASISRLNFELRKHSPFFRDLLKVEASTSPHFNYEETVRNNLASVDTSFQKMMRILMDSSHPAPLKPLTDAKDIIERVEQLHRHFVNNATHTISLIDTKWQRDELVMQLRNVQRKLKDFGEDYALYLDKDLIEIVKTLLGEKNIQKALIVIETISDPQFKARAQIELVKAEPTQENINKASTIIATISEHYQNEALIELVKALLDKKNIHEALIIIEKIIHPQSKAVAQIELAKALPTQENIQQALITITKISDPYFRAIAQIELVEIQPTQENISEVRRIISTIKSQISKNTAQATLIKVQPTPENINEAHRIIATIDHPYRKAVAQLDLLIVQPTQENIQKVIRILATINNPGDKSDCQRAFVKILLDQKNFETAISIIGTIDSPYQKDAAQVELAQRFMLQGNFKKAQQLIADIRDLGLKARAQIACFEILFANPSSIKFTSSMRPETRIGQTSLGFLCTSNTASEAHSQSESSCCCVIA